MEDPLGALRCLFYVRDIRGGQGERNIFNVLLHHIALRYPELVRYNLPCIPHYGRWDDLYALISTPAEQEMWNFMNAQLMQDVRNMMLGKSVSLLAKWLKKANSSNTSTKRLGIYTAKKLGYTVYEYKRISSQLRKHMKVTEIDMSARQWENIDYSAVPSRAMMIYRKAFSAHDPLRFRAYLDAVAKGNQVIHSSTLYPYDIVEKILYRQERYKVLEAQWNALPNYVSEGTNMLVMADVSGSMHGRPMASAIALAMYFAERNQGAYHNLFMTFSGTPQIIELQGANFFDRVQFINKAPWGFNTNFIAAMQLVLDIAVRSHCSQQQLPKALICITDMEFDSAHNINRATFSQHIKQMFALHGYTAPVLVFWNVNSRNDIFHADGNADNVILVSGQSASIFERIIKFLKQGWIPTPTEMMYSVLNSERYEMVQLPTH